MSSRRRLRRVRDRFAPARAALVRRLGVDARALATLRIALGSLVIADLVLRSRDLVAFYTDRGVLSRAALREAYPGLADVSLHALSGSVEWQVALFLLAGVAALALLVGYRTTPATIVTFLLLASLHARNPLVLNGGDSLLRRLVLWGVLLPLGDVWSVDALRRGPAATTGRITPGLGPSRGDGADDSGGSDDPDGPGGLDDPGGSGGSDDSDRSRGATGPGGTGSGWVATVATGGLLVQVVVVYLANGLFKLRSSAWSRGVALEYVFGLDRLTVGLGDVLAGHPELLGVLELLWLGLLFGSVGLVVLTGRARTALVGAFVAAHLGMVLTLRIGPFPFVSMAALLPFLPPGVWDRVERAVDRLDEWLGRVTARPSDALGGIRARIGVVRSAAVAPVAGLVGATAGGWTGDRPGLARWRGRVVRVLAAGLLVFVLVWNGATLGYVDAPPGVESAVDPEERRWDMFAEPWRADGWYVVPAETASGREVDAMHGGTPTFERPPEVAEMYPTHRWRMYLVDLRRPSGAGLRPYLAGYLCGRWNRTHEDDIRRLTVYYLEQPTRLDGPDPVRRIHVLNHSCSG